MVLVAYMVCTLNSGLRKRLEGVIIMQTYVLIWRLRDGRTKGGNY